MPSETYSLAKAANCFDSSNYVSSCVSQVCLSDVGKCFRVTEDVDRLFHLGEIIRADEHRGIATVSGDYDPFVLILDTVDHL